MRRLHRFAALAALATLASAAPLGAQEVKMTTTETSLQKEKVMTLGPILGLAIPTGDFADAEDLGFMIAAQGTYGYQGKVTFLAETGFTIFGDATPFHVAGGGRVPLGPVYVGGLAGYWTEVDAFELVPLAGIHFKVFDIGARYNGLLGDGDWFTITGALHFRIK